MRKKISIDQLQVGMFVEANILSTLVEGEIRHFLEPCDAILADSETPKRARLTHDRHLQVLADGGLIVGSKNTIRSLRETGLLEFYIDTEHGSDISSMPTMSSAPARTLAETDENAHIPGLPQQLLCDDQEDNAQESERSSHRRPLDDAPLDMYAALSQAGSDSGIEVGDLPGAPPPEQNETRGHNIESISGRRKNFGPGQSAWMKVEIDAEAQRAVMTVLSFGNRTGLGKEDIISALEDLYGIRVGLNMQVIDRLARQAAASPHRVIRGKFKIAESAKPQPGELGHIEYPILKGIRSSIEVPYAELKRLFEQERIEEITGPELQAIATAPGDELAVFHLADKASVPQNIFGEAQQPDSPEVLLKIGANVRLEGKTYRAEIFGYLCLLNNEISVLPPVWTSPEHIEAHYIAVPHVGKSRWPNWEQLVQIFELKQVRYGLREEDIEELLHSQLKGNKVTATLVAVGQPSERGEDSRIDYTFDPDKQAGEMQPDGSIDLRERNEIVAVHQGQLLARIFPATVGRNGVDLAGRTLPGIEGEKKVYRARENVSVEYDEESRPKFFLSEVDGHVRAKDGVVRVHPVVYINGDIDYDLGNIESGKDVYIKGSVRAGFSVRAGGSVSIEGIVESGASVYAQGDIIAAKGIVGDTTKIVAVGSVDTKFIQNSHVVAHGDIRVNSYLLNANVRTGGKIEVLSEGGPRGGTIVGGETHATGGIRAERIGSQSTSHTLVAIGPDPELTAQMKKLDTAVDFCRKNILRIFRTLGIKNIDAAHFRDLINQAPPGKRKAIIDILQKLKQLTKTRDHSTARREQLEKKCADLIEKAEIIVTDKAFADTRISIGRDLMVLSQDFEKTKFTKKASGISWNSLDDDNDDED